jgi:oxygen-independent coproporphyrinogen III oxidase
VYVHVPFCARRCSYCDFSIAVRREVPVARFNDAIMAELVTRGIAPTSQAISSIYLGGGTPSRLGGDGVAELIGRIREALGDSDPSTSAPLELTVEANPDDVSTEIARRWFSSGVNRVSLGVQSFDPAVLTWMHRSHGPGEIGRAVASLREAGIASLSLDLIFAVPDALGRDWSRDLDLALELEPDHLSVYGLTREEGTPFGRWVARGTAAEAPEETYEREFLEADRRLRAAGFEHYEVSNYGLRGRRAVHNSAYWSGVPYLGLGPSAHGFDGAVRRWNIDAYAAWDAA